MQFRRRTADKTKRLTIGAVAAVLLAAASSSAQQPASDMVAQLQTTATVPARCTITTSFREIESGSETTGAAVFAAIVAACTRGSSESLNLQLAGSTADCDRLALDHGWATVCGGPAAAAFVRTVAQIPASEIKAYVSIVTSTTTGPPDEAAAIAIQF
jgi:hypothetical protein